MSRLFLLLAALSLPPGVAGVAPEAYAPAALESWIPWVLAGDDRRDCPLLGFAGDRRAYEGGQGPVEPQAGDAAARPPGEAPQGDGNGERLCAWPGRLYLDLDDRGGLFVQRWRLYARAWVPLPGGPGHWPQEVRAGGIALPVVARGETPSVVLDPGDHLLTGHLAWRQRPHGLAIPPAVGLLSLFVDGGEVPFPRFDHDGRLWLEDAPGGTNAVEDALGLLVYRHIEDDIPLRVTTRLDLDVAGNARELRLGPVVLAGGMPLRIESPLPARLEPDGGLRLQARPGHWVIEVAAHHPGPVGVLESAAAPPPWPREEVWVFAAHPELRQVEPTGPKPVDPRQTRLPPEWSRLPAYLLHPGEGLRLEEIRRGDPDPAPDRLSLERDLWLDFGGRGWTARDRITGDLSRSWRLQVGPGLDLGQVLVDGEPRFITRLPDGPPEIRGAEVPAVEMPGVEVRQGRIDLVADSRIETGPERLPASGWQLDFQSMRTHLNLPPGWDLIAVSGVDNLADSWLNRWTLLDLFLVLVVALASGRLWGWGWGALALVTMVAIWQEPWAPRVIWPLLLALVALLRLLPKGPGRAGMARLRRVVLGLYRASLVVLALIALPFLVEEVRTGLYPQLERSGAVVGPTLARPAPVVLEEPPAPQSRAETWEAAGKALREKAREPLAAPPPAVLDADARVQTGPGVPTWRWKTIDLEFTGPVPRDHRIDLWLLAPGWQLWLAFLRLGLVLLLGLKIAGLLGPVLRGVFRAAPVALVLAAGLGAASANAQEFPPPALLEDLAARLAEPPDCFPSCVEIPFALATATADELELRLAVDAAAAVALPVPGNTNVWSPTAVTLNGVPSDALRRGPHDTFLLPLGPGRWQIRLTGPLPPRAQVEIRLPLRPRAMEAFADGWRIEGIDEQGRPAHQIRLVRVDPATAGTLTPTEVPPLLRISRRLVLGVDWRVHTGVERLSAADAPLVLAVPLLPGEQVLQEGARVRDGAILVGLAPGQTQTDWSSSLEPSASIRLRASEDPRLTEEWQVDVSPLWHLETAGIPDIHHQGGMDRWLPTWRPWPGEEVLLSLSRPEGVPGPTTTLDASRYWIRPGTRVAAALLELSLRSSQGGKHEILLPAGAKLERVLADGQERPLRLEGRRLSLPLVPATQVFRIEWQQPSPLTTFFAPPSPDLGMAGVDARVEVELGWNRWLLFTGGPGLGPAVLFWSLVVVLVLVAAALGRSRVTPLSTLDWLLLGLGLSQAGIWVGLLVAGWLFALGLRANLKQELPPLRFNLMQTGLFLLSLLALLSLIGALQKGLLGLPEMQVAGNGSTSTSLLWYQDRSDPVLPRVWVVSVPLLVYRALMLLWALWLAIRLLDWLRWGWQGLSRPVLWRDTKLALAGGKRRVGAGES